MVGVCTYQASPCLVTQVAAGQMDLEILLGKQTGDLNIVGYHRQILLVLQRFCQVEAGGGLVQKDDTAIGDDSGGLLGDIPFCGSIQMDSAAERAGIGEGLKQFCTAVGPMDEPLSGKTGKRTAHSSLA